jgi:hypothetical protein
MCGVGRGGAGGRTHGAGLAHARDSTDARSGAGRADARSGTGQSGRAVQSERMDGAGPADARGRVGGRPVQSCIAATAAIASGEQRHALAFSHARSLNLRTSELS